jgi:magnesium transporter
MLSYYKTVGGIISPCEGYEKGTWVSLISPSTEELRKVSEETGVDMQFLLAPLDEEETSRIESEEGQTLIIVDYPVADKGDTAHYSTFPLGIAVTEDAIITICLKPNDILIEFSSGAVRSVKTTMRTRFVFTLLLRIANKYLHYLRQIDKISNMLERQLYKSQRNKELINLLDLQKSLVFFSTSLKANESTLEKILRGRILRLYEEDQDLLEDVLIEVRQAIEMTNIYSSILTGTMDAFASVISNNLNVTMKMLTSLTIIITIPSIIFGFYGMNIAGLPLTTVWFPITLSAALMGIASIILKRLGLF